MAAAITKKKGFVAKPFARHERSVTVSDGVSWQVSVYTSFIIV